jgi:nucleoside-diphosphate-sugar epimerase
MRSFRSALVTGANGFIGSALVARLIAEKVHVICLVREKRRCLHLDSLAGVQTIEVPVFQTSYLKSRLANVSADVVFNLASYGVRQEDRDPDELIEGNVGLTAHLLEAVAGWPLRKFIHTGSCSEYGFPFSNGLPISESQPLRPLSVYGAAKAASVLFGNSYAAQLNIPFVTLRPFGVFGIHEAPQRLVPYLIGRLERDEPVDLTPGEQVRDLLFEDDLVQAFLEAAEAKLNWYESYNVCSSQPTRIRELGETVADMLQKPRDLLLWGKRAYRTDEPMWLVGDNCRFVGATSWRPTVSLEEGIRRIISNRRLLRQTGEHQHAI